MTFGINADFDGYPDIDVLSGGIRRGIDELLALAAAENPAPAGTSAAKPATTSDTKQATTSAAKPAKRPAKKAAAGSR
jgi:diacylglycerol O-acyltransferase / wax synthase